MFGRSKTTVDVATECSPSPPALVIPEPALPPAMVGEVELREYIQLAEKVDFMPGKLMEYRLLAYFRESAICVYPYGKVFAYLDQILGAARDNDKHPQSTKWGWRPMRQKDHDGLAIQAAGRGFSNGVLFSLPYQNIVPAPVLMTVARIEEAFPNAIPQIRFFVSDRFETKDSGDPFMMITGVGMTHLVIERWDEPSFRM